MSKLQSIIDYLAASVTDPFPRYIFKTEILRETPTADDIAKIHTSKWYKQLADEQWDNGSWGRFHSMDSRIAAKQKFVSTEAALRRIRELGLKKDDDAVNKVVKLMERYLRGEESWTDYTEKHHDNGKSFLTAFQFLIAANLNLFDSDNSLLVPKRDVCVNQLKKAFASGSFDEGVWEHDNKNYTGCCLKAWTVYPMWLLQYTNCLDEPLERQYLSYIWHRKDGIYYISNSAPADKRNLDDKGFTTWLSALESLSGFTLFPEFLEKDVFPHLLGEATRIMNGDVRFPAAHPITSHYSESWRDKGARKNDMLFRILRILIKC